MTIAEGHGEVVLTKGLIPVLATADHTVEQEGEFAAGKSVLLKESALIALDKGEDVLDLRTVVAPEVLHAVVISTADEAGVIAVTQLGGRAEPAAEGCALASADDVAHVVAVLNEAEITAEPA